MKTDQPLLDEAFAEAGLWRSEAIALRKVLLATGLEETLKWNKPCYSADGSNIAIIQRMKDFLALMFFKGALLTDKDGLLEVQGPNSQSAFRMRFASVAEVEAQTPAIKDFVKQAIALEKSGAKVEKAPTMTYPDELVDAFDQDPGLCAAFEALTPGRQRGWLLHFTSAKQSATRSARITKSAARILAGKGMHDR